MKYIALLRGINVGGNAVIRMVDLEKAVERYGFTGVKTVIQSGNVIFESSEDIDKATSKLEKALSENFGVNSGVIVKNRDQFKRVLDGVPEEWKKPNNLHMYIAFTLGPVTAQDVMREIKLKEGVDFIKAGPGAVYMSTMLSGLTKSSFSKLAAKKVYKDITIRNYNTAKKLLSLIEE